MNTKKEFRYITVEPLDNGDLRVKLTKEGRQGLADIIRTSPEEYPDILYTLFEDATCNGHYWLVRPEDIGALTSSPIISDDVSGEDDDGHAIVHGNVWWFPNYQVQDELKAMKSKEGWILSKAD